MTTIVAERLRQARDSAGLSRNQLADLTGIPVKSLEKFEYGTLEPSLSRLGDLGKALGVSIQWLMGDASDVPVTSPATPVQPPSVDRPIITPSSLPSPSSSSRIGAVNALLAQLDGLRARKFDDAFRQGSAYMADLQAAFRYLEPKELDQLGAVRGLYQAGNLSHRNLLTRLLDGDVSAHDDCADLGERIADTAVLGADLFGIDRKSLIEVADRLAQSNDDVEQPGFFSWGDHSAFVPVIRPALRRLALSGKGYDFTDRKKFPHREKSN